MFEELKEILQAATAPMVLISGTGIFLLTINARFTHAMGRIWDIGIELKNSPGDSVLNEVMSRLILRSKLLRYSLGMLVASVISSGVLMLLILSAQMLSFEIKTIGIILLSVSCITIVLSMIILFVDVIQSSRATILKVGRNKHH